MFIDRYRTRNSSASTLRGVRYNIVNAYLHTNTNIIINMGYELNFSVRFIYEIVKESYEYKS